MKGRNQLRIIGGAWRGRKLSFPDVPGLRPTSDRIRETLFNWLQVDIVGARCLDLYAGSGALGFEALSRGASHVVFVDSHNKVIDELKENSLRLNSDKQSFYLKGAMEYLAAIALTESNSFDVVFLDPPFQGNLVKASLLALQAASILAPKAIIYVEAEHQLMENDLPEGWFISKEKAAGKVHYYLLSL